MTAGRKPTPTALKLVKGNPGKRALPKSEAVVALSEPTPPAFLCDDAKVEWGRVCSALYAAGLMTELDRAALAAYAAAYGRWAQERNALSRALPPGLHPWLAAEAEHDAGFYETLLEPA